MDSFEPGSTVIHKDAKDRSDHGIVIELPMAWQKAGYTPVYKNRQVWIKTENLILLSKWDRLHKPRATPTLNDSLKDYWTRSAK
jgi:hypothetical protein